MAILDWLIVVVSILGSVGIGLFFSRKATRDKDSYLLAGRSLGWFIAGTSIVATTFSVRHAALCGANLAADGHFRELVVVERGHRATGGRLLFRPLVAAKRSHHQRRVPCPSLRSHSGDRRSATGPRRVRRRADQLHHHRLRDTWNGEDPYHGAAAFGCAFVHNSLGGWSQRGGIDPGGSLSANTCLLHDFRPLRRGLRGRLPIPLCHGRLYRLGGDRLC